ncbi:hypothetical protein GH714_034616 [Hevea brasiliensis]|uniref:Transcription factor CBF/NF-Y/archaeal histone domain-containing protein n=1 Tax=Hevea brasiliensis TaxID=3981 RepID=A0A6A6M407_HEVBR|nr:hypothetical protein GH714_034616 [Hevea brasiliensis]
MQRNYSRVAMIIMKKDGGRRTLGVTTSEEIGIVDRETESADELDLSGDIIGEDGIMKEQDRLLPIANVGRIMKQILPPNAKISKEAKETMQECVSEFISFVTGEASDKCHKEKRKTVNGDDICWALATLGFDDYAEPLKSFLGGGWGGLRDFSWCGLKISLVCV